MTFTHSPALALPSYEFVLEFTGLDKDENRWIPPLRTHPTLLLSLCYYSYQLQ